MLNLAFHNYEHMPRKKNHRNVCGSPNATYYKPAGIPLRHLTEVELSLDEYESIRLADNEGLYQEDAAQKMQVSRQTFGRILSSAHKKIADALVNGKAIAIRNETIE